MLPSRGSTRCLRAQQAAEPTASSWLPRWRFTNDRRPRLLTLPLHQRPPTAALDLSVHRPSSSFPFHRLLVISSCLVRSGRPAAGTSVTPVRFDRHLLEMANNMLPNRGSPRCLGVAGTGTDSRLPRWRFTNDRLPRLLTLPSIVRPPLPVSPSRHFLLCGPVRPPGGQYLSDAGSVRSAPVRRANNMLPNRGSTPACSPAAPTFARWRRWSTAARWRAARW